MQLMGLEMSTVCNFGLPGSACNACQPSNRSQNLSCQLFGFGLTVDASQRPPSFKFSRIWWKAGKPTTTPWAWTSYITILENHAQVSKGMKKQTSAVESHKTLASTAVVTKSPAACHRATSWWSPKTLTHHPPLSTEEKVAMSSRLSPEQNSIRDSCLQKPFTKQHGFPTKWHRESPEHRHLLKQGDPRNASPMATAGASQRRTWTRHRETSSSWDLAPTSHTSMGWMGHEFVKIKQTEEHFGKEFWSHKANQQLREAEVHSPKVIMKFRHTVFHAAQGCTAIGQHQWQPFNVQAWTQQDPISFLFKLTLAKTQTELKYPFPPQPERAKICIKTKKAEYAAGTSSKTSNRSPAT